AGHLYVQRIFFSDRVQDQAEIRYVGLILIGIAIAVLVKDKDVLRPEERRRLREVEGKITEQTDAGIHGDRFQPPSLQHRQRHIRPPPYRSCPVRSYELPSLLFHRREDMQ